MIQYDPSIDPSIHLSCIHQANPLLVIILGLVVDDVEEAELVDTLGGRDDTEPVTELLLLEELLCPIHATPISIHSNNICFTSRRWKGDIQVLEVSARELGVRNDLNLSISHLRDLDDVAKVSNTPVNLYLVLEELLECGDIENLVAGGLRGVDNELQSTSKLQSESNHMV